MFYRCPHTILSIPTNWSLDCAYHILATLRIPKSIRPFGSASWPNEVSLGGNHHPKKKTNHDHQFMGFRTQKRSSAPWSHHSLDLRRKKPCATVCPTSASERRWPQTRPNGWSWAGRPGSSWYLLLQVIMGNQFGSYYRGKHEIIMVYAGFLQPMGSLHGQTWFLICTHGVLYAYIYIHIYILMHTWINTWKLKRTNE